MNAQPTTATAAPAIDRRALHRQACVAIHDARLGGPTPRQWALCRAAARALRLDRAWQVVRKLLQEAPEGTLRDLWAAVAPGEILPHKRHVLEACTYRITSNERAAAAATSPADLQGWPEDAHALEALRRAPVEHRYAAALIAGVHGLRRTREIQQQQANAPKDMEALRRRKVRN